MEETVRLPEDPDTDVTLVFCDVCNPDWDYANTFIPPKEWLDALGWPPGTKVSRGVLRGTSEEALAQGWREEEFGHRCPVCVAEEPAEGDEEAHQTLLKLMRARQTEEVEDLLKKR